MSVTRMLDETRDESETNGKKMHERSGVVGVVLYWLEEPGAPLGRPVNVARV